MFDAEPVKPGCAVFARFLLGLSVTEMATVIISTRIRVLCFEVAV
jgi:hypothetical protein